jgi:hypothetical protein
MFVCFLAIENFKSPQGKPKADVLSIVEVGVYYRSCNSHFIEIVLFLLLLLLLLLFTRCKFNHIANRNQF